ncbi:MAG: ABC transporter permease [Pseudomonadota bacterium]
MTVRAVARKELRQLSRDPRSIAVLVLVPSMMLVLFGYVLSFDVRHISLSVVDQDRSADSRALVAALTSSEYFDLVHRDEQEAAALARLDRGEATVALVLPPGLGRDLARGELATVQAVVDGSNANAAQTALAYLQAFVGSHGATLLARSGLSAHPPVELRQTVLYNPELKSERFLVPGLIAFVLMISCTIATALSVVRERETGTMEQLLVSPLTPAQVIVGKSLPYAGVSVLATVLVLVTGMLLFGVEIRGSLWWLGLASLLFILGAQGLGLLISTATESQQLAFMVATFITLLPTFLLSGFAFPIRSMPAAIQLVTYAVPARYFLSVLRGIILRGTGPERFWPDLLALTLFAVVTMGIARARLKRVRL